MHKHFRIPPFAKNAKDGAPILLVMPANQKPGPPAFDSLREKANPPIDLP
jgi:hypothetical protein